jgi:hypothetical protein
MIDREDDRPACRIKLGERWDAVIDASVAAPPTAALRRAASSWIIGARE